MNVEFTDLVTRCVNSGYLEGVQSLVLEVEDPITVQTHEMMVLMNFGVETSRSAWMANLIDDPYANQRIEHAIHGCPRHAWQLTPDGVEYLFRGRMILAREDGLQDGPPLYRQRQALPAAQVLELLKPFSLGCRIHLHTCR